MSQEHLQGVLCMRKPDRFTSFDVIAKLRGMLRMRRLGHTGTLDPMATGVLPVLVGRATGAADIIPNQDKTYRATVRFGLETDTEDIWGTRIAEYSNMHVTQEDIEGIMPQFIGEISQIPPMYSAVSVDGKRLYELARKGIEVERPARTVQIYSLTLEEWDEEQQIAVFCISCGKGTYIRTLLSDMGKALGGGAVMMSLCRTSACGFTLDQCYSFDDIARFARAGTIKQHLIPTDQLFVSLPKLQLNENLTSLYRNGVKLSTEQLDGLMPLQESYRVYGGDGSFLGLAAVDDTKKVLRVQKNF